MPGTNLSTLHGGSYYSLQPFNQVCAIVICKQHFSQEHRTKRLGSISFTDKILTVNNKQNRVSSETSHANIYIQARTQMIYSQ